LQSDTIVAQLLLLCLTLQQSRAPTVKGTASAIVQQFVALLLDHVAAEGLPAAPAKEGALAAPTEEALKSLSVATRCSYLAIRDLCLLANGEPALWLPSSGPVGVPFALEVIQRTLQSHKALFISLTPFRYLLRERVCSLVLKTMQAPQQEWPAALRLAHLTSTLLSGYAAVLRTECEILLSMLVKTAAADTSRGMSDAMNHRQFMSQLLTLRERVERDIGTSQLHLQTLAHRMLQAEAERLKMKTLTENDRLAVQKYVSKREQHSMDELGMLHFNQARAA
jgi:flagellar export protein FliJ